METAITLVADEIPPTAFPVLTPAVPAYVWQRLEAYIAWRYSPRGVRWTVEGPGLWKAPLAPAVVTDVEVWNSFDMNFEAVTLDASPFDGYVLPCGTYRFTATVGDGVEVPAIVAQAAQRLSAYLAADAGTPGSETEYREVPGVLVTRTSRGDAAWMAKALVNSGAADLLRAYRRV